MDRLEKVLQKLSKEERHKICTILQKLSAGQFVGLDIKKLQGREDVFRVRKGTMRILYRIDRNVTFILAIERRGKNTYKNL